MILNICKHKFDSKDIFSINIKDDIVFVDAKDDFYRLTSSDENDIKDAKNWIAFRELTEAKLSDAVQIIMMVCEHYANEYKQCEECPLKRDYGCIIQNAPVNWQMR